MNTLSFSHARSAASYHNVDAGVTVSGTDAGAGHAGEKSGADGSKPLPKTSDIDCLGLCASELRSILIMDESNIREKNLAPSNAVGKRQLLKEFYI